MKIVEGKSLKQVALEELIEERTKEYVEKLKKKLKEKESAKLVVANIEREIADLELKIYQETDVLFK